MKKDQKILRSILVLFFLTGFITILNYAYISFLKSPVVFSADASSGSAQTYTVKFEQTPVSFEAVGNLAPRTVTTLASKIMGTITSVNKREGDEVTSSEVVVTIDETDIQADLAALDASLAEIESNKVELEKNLTLAAAGRTSAEANQKLASVTYERFKKLNESKSISGQDFDKAEAEYKMASSKLNEAIAQFEVVNSKKAQISAKQKQIMANIEKVNTMKKYARMSSPTDGRVTFRQAEVGALATPGMPLMTIEDYKNMQFQAVVPEQIINRIKIGDQVKVIVDIIEDQVFIGSVVEIAPTGDIMTHTFMVKIALKYDPRLKSGMYARGLIFKETVKTIFIPSDFIVKRGQLYLVFSPDGGFKFIRPGAVYENMTEVLSGLDSGEVIVKK
ncbi:MAG TPA: efflux RND transporter periplasmic adaptor subunit [Candidatus Wallbacteria bacterium]|nr:efflux RND transporter periplasmic adaptor subunit [Candidatus Wallbacteria bacterium]